MYRMLGMAAAAALVLGTSMAQAEEVTGAVENIDLTRNTFEVEDKVFTASPNNTVGPTLEELKEGDQITVFYGDAGSGQPINATTITKEEE
jgi:hypothetical protein